MEKTDKIKAYLIAKGINVKQRINMPCGGQYLYNFLLEYEKHIEKKVKKEILKSLNI